MHVKIVLARPRLQCPSVSYRYASLVRLPGIGAHRFFCARVELRRWMRTPFRWASKRKAENIGQHGIIRLFFATPLLKAHPERVQTAEHITCEIPNMLVRSILSNSRIRGSDPLWERPRNRRPALGVGIALRLQLGSEPVEAKEKDGLSPPW